MNWIEIYNRLFEIINQSDPNYYSGPRFISIAKEFNPYFPDYNLYIDERRRTRKSTSRKDFFRDILLNFPEEVRVRFVKRILQDTREYNTAKCTELSALLEGKAKGPAVSIPQHVWNADRLNEYLEDIDTSITQGNHQRAISLSYTCLEGFFKAFIEHNIPDKRSLTELIAMSREIQNYLKGIVTAYPDEALKLLNHITHAVDKTRNSFSESHFGEEAEKWLSTFVRDCMNSAIRLLLSFM
jgi:hypothetical protein